MLLKEAIPTPALVLDLDAFEANLALMAEHVKRSGKNLRPHAKAHKCVEIAKRQIAAGASGVCVATMHEAEVMFKAGVTALLLTSPVADPRTTQRVVQTGAKVVVDHAQQAAWYEEAASTAGHTLDVLIDLDVGDHRTGASSIEQLLEIAHAVDRSKHLHLRGIQAYSVHGSHAGGADRAERQRVSHQAFEKAAEAQHALSRAGFATEILTGGSTGTWDIDTCIPHVTEIQAGSFVLMDVAYAKLNLPFRHALTVLTTVVSANHAEFVTVDGGFKSFATDRGYGPEAPAYPGSAYRWGGDEFGYLDIDDTAAKPRLGDRIEFIPPHCDPTVNLYRTLYACRGDCVEEIWPVHSGK